MGFRHHIIRAVIRGLFLGMVMLSVSACAGLVGQPNFEYHRSYRFDAEGPEIHIRYTREDQATINMVAGAFETAVQTLEEWGHFRKPITVTIHPDHDSLERAVRRKGYPWLRGWAKYETIDIQSPRTWGGVGLRRRVRELVVHEMTHILMYQYIGNENTWTKRSVPLWFREGHASYVAKQGYRRSKPDELAAYYCGAGYRGDPFTEPKKLLRESPELVYGAGHQGFTELMKTASKEQIMRVYRRTDETGDFREAFHDVFGIYLAQWEDSYREKLVSLCQDKPKSKELKKLLNVQKGSATDDVL